MARTVVQKILAGHLVAGDLRAGGSTGSSPQGGEIGIRIDQTLTQDATGTTAMLLLEAMGIQRVRTELSVSYVDHNMAQFGPENHNDHLYLQSIARKVGAWHSRPGNGICHQVHLERFARPGRTLLGSDSHTPTAGGMGSLAIGAGGLDVAVAMGGGPFYLQAPRIIGVELRGRLGEWVAPKDVVLRVLSILTTQGNVGCMVEYFGEALAALDVPGRATITNMGAELGVTTSVFPADEVTRQFLAEQGREEQFEPLAADAGAAYGPITKRLHVERDAATIEKLRQYGTDVRVGEPGAHGLAEVTFGHLVIDLDALEPLAAAPSSPGNVVAVREVAGTKVGQVLIGSCTNSSYRDLMTVARVLDGLTVHGGVELGIAPGSRQVLESICQSHGLARLVRAGARVLECACGPCIGLGFSPAEGAVSLRTFNRNFAGRSGTRGDAVYLVSPETAVAAALIGEITDPRELPERLGIAYPAPPAAGVTGGDDTMLQPPLPESEAAAAEVVRGSTIVKPPAGAPLGETLRGPVTIQVGDKVTTDHIMPAGALLKLRSNVPQYAKHVFECFNEAGRPTFAQRALAAKERGEAAVIVAGASYGQGSSREHAALCPMYLGVRLVLAKSIERIHQANLVNFGILPLTFAEADDYDRVAAGDVLAIDDVPGVIASAETATVRNETQGTELAVEVNLAPRQRAILAGGGLLNYTREQAGA